MTKYFLFFQGLIVSSLGWADDVATRPPYPTTSVGVSAGSMFQMFLSLLLVLGLIVLVAWLFKRMNIMQQSSNNVLKVISSAAVGQRERVVLIEVNDTYLLIGIAPNQIRTLHKFDKTEDVNFDAELTQQATQNKPQFAQLLSSVLKKNKK